MGDSHVNLIEDRAAIRAVVKDVKTIAVLGIKPESSAGQPAHDVPRYLAGQGYEIIPVPVYYPEVKEILGRPVFRTVSAIPGEIDLVDVFRRPQDIDQHVDDLIAKKPRAVWFQLGIRNDAAAKRLTDAGIDVVQDRCLLVDHRMYAKRR